MSASEHVFDPRALDADARPAAVGERDAEASLRPAAFADFVGQEPALRNLQVAIEAAGVRGDVLDHVLLSGSPGLGKTSLARILAREVGGSLHSTTGPALDRPRDLVGILTQLRRGDLLFIDEIHRVPAAVEEYLYTAMEDFHVDLTLDQGPHARVMHMTLERFTLVGATTRDGLLSAPFRSRFGLFERLTPYAPAELERVLARSATILGVELAPAAAAIVSRRSRGTPRIANRFLRRARDLAQVSGAACIDADLAEEALARMGVDEHGLEAVDRSILACLAREPRTPVGIKTIAAAVGESEDTLEEVFEPHLLRCGLVRKTARGREITTEGCRAIGVEPDGDDGRRGGLFP